MAKTGRKRTLEEKDVAKVKSKFINAKSGTNSQQILGVIGCANCPWRRTCNLFDVRNKIGCEARKQNIISIRRSLGRVDSNLFERAIVLREEVESEAANIRAKGESPLQNRAWRDMWKTDLELAKFLAKIKHGNTTHHVVHKSDEDDVIIINQDLSGDKKEENDEGVEDDEMDESNT